MRADTKGTELLEDEREYLESIQGDEFLESRFNSYVESMAMHGDRYAVKTTLNIMMPTRGPRTVYRKSTWRTW